MKSWTPKPELYDFGRPFPPEQVGRLFLLSKELPRILPSEQMATVYEPGCGTGRVILPLAKSFPFWMFVGGEISKAVRDVCQARQQASGLPNLALIEADVCESNPHGPFDMIVHSSVLHAVDQWQKAVQILVSLLKPTGIFALIGDDGDLYDEALGRVSKPGCDPILSDFWSSYRKARLLSGAPDAEASQVGVRWDIESSEVAEAIASFGFVEFERVHTDWQQVYTVSELSMIVRERCYSSMFTVDAVTYQTLLRHLDDDVSRFPAQQTVISRHQALCRFFRRLPN